MRNAKILISTFIILISLSLSLLAQQKQDLAFAEAVKNGVLVNEGFNRSIKYVNAWTKYADPGTGLIPRNIKESKDYWNAWDAAADNYPYMVLTSSILMPTILYTKSTQNQRTKKR